MPDEYMDVISFRQRGEKAFAHKIGSAKHGKDGKINVYLDSSPLPDKDGRVSLVISPRLERTAGYVKPAPRRAPEPEDDFNDPVPF